MRAVPVTLITLQFLCNAAFCQEVVTDKPLDKSEVLATLPVLALRKLPVEQVIAPLDSQSNEWVLDASAAVRSAYASKSTKTGSAPVMNVSPKGHEALNDPYPSNDKWFSPENDEVVNAVRLWEQGYDKKNFARVQDLMQSSHKMKC